MKCGVGGWATEPWRAGLHPKGLGRGVRAVGPPPEQETHGYGKVHGVHIKIAVVGCRLPRRVPFLAPAAR